MKVLLMLAAVGCIFQVVRAPPVTQKKVQGEGHDEDSPVKQDLEDYMEYHRYLKEVVQALESDPEFREKLEKAEEVDIRTGKIAHELDFVNHNVRTKLDELKRQELERLRHLATKQFELSNDIDTDHAKISSQVAHLDHNNPHTFEIEDLKKLIIKTTEDLEEADKKRRDEFKQYEMQKEFEVQQRLQGLDDEHKKEFVKQIHDQEEKHKKHEPLHHPGSRQQLEEVWEKQDHMDSQQFDPKTFFMLHDVDGNGMWDEVEVKALFLKELDKMYQRGAPEDDLRERQEEMERMREHVFRESDTNRDGFISYEEFLIQSRRDEFEKDPGWKGLDEQQIYTPEEYHEFERRRLEEVQRMVQQGLIPPQPVYGGNDYKPHAGYQHQQQPQYPYQEQQHPQQYHQNAIPQGQYQQPNINYNQQGQMHQPQVQMHQPQVQMHQPQVQMHQPQGQQIHYPKGQMQNPQGQVQQGPGQQQHGQGQVQPQGQPQPLGHQQHGQGQVQQSQGQPQPNQGQVSQVQVQPQAQVHQPQAPIQNPQVPVQQPQVQVSPPDQSHNQGQQNQQPGNVQKPLTDMKLSQGNPQHVQGHL